MPLFGRVCTRTTLALAKYQTRRREERNAIERDRDYLKFKNLVPYTLLLQRRLRMIIIKSLFAHL
jgi:hypothetical protein